MTDTAQLNAEIESEELRRVKRDALDVGTSLKDYVQAALIHFRQSKSIDERRRVFNGRKKIIGRRISL